ncbi:MAG: Hsp33 family molecular chaperone HslO, partial [Myxococcota bacterium]
MKDAFRAGIIRRSNISVGLAVTTESCRRAQSIHQTSEFATIAIGRLLTSATLATFSQSRKGQLSLQVVGSGPFGNMFADVTDEGRIRTMVKNPRVALPRLPGENDNTRRAIGHAFGDGTLSVIWQPLDEPFAQSTTSLVSGELDEDVQHFLAASDQVQTTLIANLALDGSNVVAASGVVLQAMPDVDPD